MMDLGEENLRRLWLLNHVVNGQVLNLKIINNESTTISFVTINGNTTIVQAGIFSEHGIVYVIDKPLVLLPDTI
jgi:hypothetical protein